MIRAQPATMKVNTLTTTYATRSTRRSAVRIRTAATIQATRKYRQASRDPGPKRELETTNWDVTSPAATNVMGACHNRISTRMVMQVFGVQAPQSLSFSNKKARLVFT